MISYNASFKKVKNDLIKLHINAPRIYSLLKNFKTIKVKVGYGMYDVTPTVMVSDNNPENGICISSFIIYKPTKEAKLHIGYKRNDDWLGLDGLILSRSKAFKHSLEMIRCKNNRFVWLTFKIKEFLNEKVSVIRSFFSKSSDS